MTKDLWLVVLGSFLAFGGRLVAFFIQWYWNRRNQQRIVNEFLGELFKVYIRTYPRIIETYEKSGVLWNDLLNQVSADLALYERNKEHTIIIQDFSFREKIWDWFSNLRTVINMCLSLNSFLIHAPNDQWALDQRIKPLPAEAGRFLDD